MDTVDATQDVESGETKKSPHATDRSSARLVPHELPGCGVWRRFLPAIFVYPLWFYAMMKHDAWADAFGHFYVMSFTMIFGSFVAGSTPVGGGAVAFPVMVLYIKLLPEEGRDFSLMIQSIGMTSASFLILSSKRQLCHFWLIQWFLLSSLPGLLLGFEISMNSRLTSLSFTTTISCFTIAFFYHRECRFNRKGEISEAQNAAVEAWELMEGHFDLEKTVGWRAFGTSLPFVLVALACIFGMTGGFLTAKLGSGADMLAYIFGILWNSLVPEEAQMSENMLTASSVLIMAGCSVMSTFLRMLTAEISREVLLCWAACVPVVVLGAPLGSMLLNPSSTKILRRCFYVFVLVQFISMGALQLRGDFVAWTVVLVAILITIVISHMFLR